MRSKRRITVMLDENIIKKLRVKQAKEIQQTSSSISFSKVLNSELRKYMK